MNKTILVLALSLFTSAATAATFTLPRISPQDAFSLEEACAVVDTRFIKQPTLGEAVAMLAPCMEALSFRYGVMIAAGHGTLGRGDKERNIRIMIAGQLAAGNPVLYHLNYALSLRGNRIVSHPARVVSLQPRLKAREAGMRVRKKLKRLPQVFAVSSEMSDVPSIGKSGPVR